MTEATEATEVEVEVEEAGVKEAPAKKEKKPTKTELKDAAIQEEIDNFDYDDDVYRKVYDEETNTWEYPVLPLPLLSRAAAIKMGMKKYFTGESCPHGHVAPRRVKGGCTECFKARVAARRKAKAAEKAAAKAEEAAVEE